jgi:O-antigen/teichoic acid export membrane protein
MPQNSAARHVAILASGTALAQAIPIFIMPILTRLYTPEDFGMVGLYMACVSILAVIATGRYELAITLPSSDGEANNILMLTLKLCSFVSFILFIPIYFFGERIAVLIGNYEIKNWFYLLPLSVLATGAFNALQLWCNRSSRYRQMSINRIQSSGYTTFTNLMMGLYKIKGGMIIGAVIGQSLSSLLMINSIRRHDLKVFEHCSWENQKVIAKKYDGHPKHIAPAQLIGVVAQQLPIFIISTVFSFATLGFFSLAYRLVSLPTVLIANAIGDVYRQKIAVAYNERGEFRDILLVTLKRTTIISLPPFIIVFLLAPNLFAFVFGSEWRIAGDYAQILIVASFFQFILTPLDKGALVVSATKYILFWHTLRLLGLLVIATMFHRYKFSEIHFIYCLVFLNITLYILDGAVGYSISKGKS